MVYKLNSYTFSGMMALNVILLQAQIQSRVFSFTGAMQTFTVPRCVTTLTIDMSGAAGEGKIADGCVNRGGWGGRVRAVYPVEKEQLIYVFVGGQNGYNGGGSGTQYGGRGGGASDIRIAGTTLSHRVLVAGGGGGGGRGCLTSDNWGGDGGDTIGGIGWNCGLQNWWIGTGGTQNAGGQSLGNMAMPGILGSGGDGGNNEGGGGGGGYYGGGGGGYGGGGGGSNYADTIASQVSHYRGMRAGHGQVIIFFSYNGQKPDIEASASRTLICRYETTDITVKGADSYTWNSSQTSPQISVSPTLNTYYIVSGENSENGCISTATVYIKVHSCIGLPENEVEEALTISPNPAHGSFQIKSGSTLSCRLYDETGTLKNEYELKEENDFEVRVNALPPGIYFLRNTSTEKMYCRKIIVNPE